MEGLHRHDIVAGRTIQIGYRPFEQLERVELIVGGTDVTYPSSNLAYRKAVLDEIGGFDERFHTLHDNHLDNPALPPCHAGGFQVEGSPFQPTRDQAVHLLL